MNPPLPNRSRRSSAILRFTILTLSTSLLSAAEPPGISALDPIALAPGRDVYEPLEFAGNNVTHTLYVIGAKPEPDTFPTSSGNPTFGVKVIDTSSNTVVAGVDLGLYEVSGGYLYPFTPQAIAVDPSQATGGNKIYVLGYAGYYYLRAIDGATNSNETGPGTDLFLPDGGDQLVVNPNNHKIYIVSYDGKVTVIDGLTRQIIKTISAGIGLYDHGLVINPQNNKVFVFGSQASLIIEGSDDSYAVLDAAYSVRALGFDPATSRLLLVASKDNLTTPVLYALDGTTAAELQSQSDIPENVRALAIDSTAGLVYLGQPIDWSAGTTGKVATFTADSLFPMDLIYPVATARLLFMGAGTAARLYFLNYDTYANEPQPEYYNMVGALTPLNGQVQKITVGYSPALVAVNPDSNRVYIADDKAPELIVLDGSDGHVLDRISVAPAASDIPSGPFYPTRSLAVSAAKNRIYLSHTTTDETTSVSTMSIDVYDGITDEFLSAIVVNTDGAPVYPRIAVDDTRGRLYATNYSSVAEPTRSVKVFDLDSQAFITTVPLSDYRDIASNPVTGMVYVPSYQRDVEIVDPESFNVTSVTIAGNYPGLGPLAVNLMTNRIFVVEIDTANSVAVVNGETGEMETTIANTDANTGDTVTDVAVDAVTNTVFLCDDSDQVEANGRITIFDGNNNYAYLGEIEVGRYPERIAFNTATRQLLVPNTQDGTVSVLQSSTPAPPDRLANISTRLGVETDDNVLIGGFIISGPTDTTKQILIRGIGPSLTAFGVAGALADPTLELHNGATVLTTNDNWKTEPNGQSQQTAIEATGLAPTDDLESAILMDLSPGAYTAIMSGTLNGTGVGLVEVYDLTESGTTKMVNISTRGPIGVGDDVMIGGVIVTGANPSRVLLRAIGPSLTSLGVAGALQDPVLELHDSQGALITTNDDWQDDNQAAIATTGLAPTADRESAILATLYPSNYTAIVRGKNDSTGIGLVEAYYLP